MKLQLLQKLCILLPKLYAVVHRKLSEKYKNLNLRESNWKNTCIQLQLAVDYSIVTFAFIYLFIFASATQTTDNPICSINVGFIELWCDTESMPMAPIDWSIQITWIINSLVQTIQQNEINTVFISIHANKSANRKSFGKISISA